MVSEKIVEYVDKNRLNSPDGLTLEKWLESKGLEHFDLYQTELKDAESNIIGTTIVDLGGIQNAGRNLTYKHGSANDKQFYNFIDTYKSLTYKHGNANWLLSKYMQGYSSKGILKILENQN